MWGYQKREKPSKENKYGNKYHTLTFKPAYFQTFEHIQTLETLKQIKE